ncbi:MAG TPA: ribbon-helix-helix domain-containing protein [Stellaceae bacterium]|nr:ribbon-helix-helix domain-containing protein [Stellaceae bacterium]
MSLDSFDIAHDTLRRRHVAPRRPSTLINRNVTVAGHRTSVRLEAAMWDALHHVCERERRTINDLVTQIAREQIESSLTAAIRVYVMNYFRAAASRPAA